MRQVDGVNHDENGNGLEYGNKRPDSREAELGWEVEILYVIIPFLQLRHVSEKVPASLNRWLLKSSVRTDSELTSPLNSKGRSGNIRLKLKSSFIPWNESSIR